MVESSVYVLILLLIIKLFSYLYCDNKDLNLNQLVDKLKNELKLLESKKELTYTNEIEEVNLDEFTQIGNVNDVHFDDVAYLVVDKKELSFVFDLKSL